MMKSIKISDLKVGMYVTLPVSWLKHSFMKSHFLIKSDDQIDKIKQMKIKEVEIDTSKGQVIQDIESISYGSLPVNAPPKWDPEKDINDELKEAIHSNNLAPEKKAKVVYDSSLNLMMKLFENPTTEIIGNAKQGITHVVDLILSDDEIASYLFQITSHDFYTYTHSVNVGVLSISLSKRLYSGSTDHNMHELGAGFFLHDLGKVRVDAAIINKPGRLSEEEMFIMRTHPYQSYRILKETNQLSEEARIIALQHHERQDGTGYPRRLVGDEIHEYGVICCIADVFDALTAERSYKKALAPFEALKVMKEEMLEHFHKEIFENFVQLFH